MLSPSTRSISTKITHKIHSQPNEVSVCFSSRSGIKMKCPTGISAMKSLMGRIKGNYSDQHLLTKRSISPNCLGAQPFNCTFPSLVLLSVSSTYFLQYSSCRSFFSFSLSLFLSLTHILSRSVSLTRSLTELTSSLFQSGLSFGLCESHLHWDQIPLTP